MNLKEIKELINLMNENNLFELEIEREGTKIRLKKNSLGGFEAFSQEAAMSPRIVHNIAPQKEQVVSGKEEKSNLVPIKTPMVGTFYRSPSPDAKPYVEIGQVIEPGQVVCIIEAMKLMNEIKAEVKGKIIEVLVENSSPVEYGQALFMTEPA